MKNKEDILAKWLSGEVTDAELEAAEGPDALQELRRLTQEVDQWSMPKYDAGAGYENMKERLQTKAPSSGKSMWLKYIFAASIIGALLYLLLMFSGSKSTELKAEPGQNFNYAFQDGSEVWLNDGSSLKYKASEWSTQRSIQLEGEAMFEVSKGAPFIVNTPNGTVTVLGTKFNVRAWGKSLYVECYEGRVQVAAGVNSKILTAKEGLSIIGNSMNEYEVANNSIPFWQIGMSRFYDEKLRIVFDELERQYKISVELRVPDRIFSGNFKHGDLDQALSSICKPLDLRYTISKDEKSVVIE